MAEDNSDQGDLFSGTEFERQEDYVAPKRSYVKRNEKAANCSICGRPLSDPTSVQMGIGPECFSKHIAEGKNDYTSNLFMLNENGSKKIASCTLELVAENVILVVDLDDNPELPSVTNSIDEIVRYFNIDLGITKVIVKGSDGMYCKYNRGFKFLSWEREEAISKI